jgi:aryl-alcohol dehydrogenase-like predicted oxidoreductase
MRQDIWRQQSREGEGQKVPLLTQPKWINHWLIEQFARWREGGPPMETRVEENVHASAMVFAAIESQRSGLPVKMPISSRRPSARRWPARARQGGFLVELRNVGRSASASRWWGSAATTSAAASISRRRSASVHRALDAGIALFDTADTYGNRGHSESFLGELLGDRRKDVVLATKFGMAMDDAGVKKGRFAPLHHGGSGSEPRAASNGLDRPVLPSPARSAHPYRGNPARARRPRSPGQGSLHRLLQPRGWQVADAAWTSRHHGLPAFVCAQDEYSLLERRHERHLFPALSAFGMGVLPYYPLAGGLLTGKYRREAPMPEGARLSYTKASADKFLTERNWMRAEALAAFATARGRSLTELAFAWLAAQPLVSSVIAGATKPEQIDANVKAVGWRLSTDEMDEVNRITAP